MTNPCLHYRWCHRPPLQLGRYIASLYMSEARCPVCRMVSYFPDHSRVMYDQAGFAPIICVRQVWADTPLPILDAVIAAQGWGYAALCDFIDDLDQALYQDVTTGVISCPAQLLAAMEGLPFLIDYAVVTWTPALQQGSAALSRVSS